jgi:ribosomal protein L29
MSRVPYQGHLNSYADTEFATDSLPIRAMESSHADVFMVPEPPDGRDIIIERLNRERIMLRTELAGLRSCVTDLKTQVQSARIALQFFVDDHEREMARLNTLLQEKSAEITRLRLLLKHPVVAANSTSSNDALIAEWLQPNPLPRGMR